MIDCGKENLFTLTEMATTIPELKFKKRSDEEEIRPEMLNALNGEGVHWLTSVCVRWRGNLKKH